MPADSEENDDGTIGRIATYRPRRPHADGSRAQAGSSPPAGRTGSAKASCSATPSPLAGSGDATSTS
jgi:hypothetical protein